MSVEFFTPVGNCYAVAFTTASANVLVSPTPSTMSQVRITNNSGNLCFVSFSTTPIGNIDHPTAGTGNSTATISIPTAQTSLVSTGITAPGNVYINTISPGGTGTIYVQAGV